ncbi:hypothetical protein N7462_003280 [Penicillium macrosclerotiorum]|uniref:uncharacterized protein n=1 Tax=Penicillium macrosclerotiorum TaxID=303699 RepID=UPI002549269C|nr:uncharacterized protein N7462_003280 [Penicillium macrosclerotiorum]KAJ5688888.1 hypothetical protein N7462_003280 [Penicillium macrosclerotiorum]
MELLPRQALNVIIPPLAPSIESDRLRLRPVTESDLPGLFAIRSRPEVAKSNYPKTPFKSIQETREWVSSKVFTEGNSDIVGRSFNFVILDKSIPENQEQIIGYVSVNCVVPCPEIGYSLLPEAWGQGYATEALKLMLKLWWDLPRRTWGDDPNDEVEKIYAISEQTNVGSCCVLRKCGFEIEKEARFETTELYVWGLKKPV